MKSLVLTLMISLFQLEKASCLTTFEQNNLAGYIQCGNTMFCPKNFKPYREPDSNKYKMERYLAEEIIDLMDKGVVGMSNKSSILELIQHHKSLCNMDSIGFLMDDDIADYEVSCVWSGSSQYGECVPVPPEYTSSPFHYIKGEKWVEKLENVRRLLRCDAGNSSNGSIVEAVLRERKIMTMELFICNDRCDQGGISYPMSLIMMITLTLSFFKNCVVAE